VEFSARFILLHNPARSSSRLRNGARKHLIGQRISCEAGAERHFAPERR